jgi:uncharacterized membrane protein YeiH
MIWLTLASASAISGGDLRSQRKSASPFAAIAANGWFTSWAIDAVTVCIVVRRVTRSSFDCVSRKASWARLVSVTSIAVPMNIFGLVSASCTTDR